MHGPNKEKNILIIVLIFVVVILGVVLVLHRKRPVPVQAPPVSQAQVSSVNWNSMIPEITTALDKSFSPSDVGSRAPVSIVQTGDVTGDGNSEAFVDMGFGGASTDELALVGLENGAVTVFSYKGSDGSVGPVDFSQGSAVLHAVGVGMDSADNAIYSTELDYNGDGTLSSCTLSAYQWDPMTQEFEYSESISNSQQTTYCANIASGNTQ